MGLALMIIGASTIIINIDNESKKDSASVSSMENQLDEPISVSKITSNADGTVVSYQGQADRTALELLKDLTEVVTEDSSFGEYVTTINGVEQGDDKYWMFYINGEAASVGAGEYITKEGDNVEWKLEG